MNEHRSIRYRFDEQHPKLVEYDERTRTLDVACTNSRQRCSRVAAALDVRDIPTGRL